jgi:hypothetical protein
MQTSPTILSAWAKLKIKEISCSEALKLLVDEQGNVNLVLLDRDVVLRFLRHFPDRNSLPTAIPLLLWRGCYYLEVQQIIQGVHLVNKRLSSQ